MTRMRRWSGTGGWSELRPQQLNMFRADGDEQVFAAGHKRVRMEPVRLSDQARYQELRGNKDSNKSYTN
jgi:hypothetical protein